MYARGFFELQIAFAERVAALSGVPLATALLEHTNLFVRLGFGRGFDAAHPGWRRYAAGVAEARDGEAVRAWTWRCYADEPEARTAPVVDVTVGCFSLAVQGGERVRVHFRNVETQGVAPLAPGRRARRRTELASLFGSSSSSSSACVGDDVPVVGASWLYNLGAYRSLFPPAYVASARPLPGAFRSMALWGQLLAREGRPRPGAADAFRARVARARSLAALEASFPLEVLTLTAPVRVFRDHYAVRARRPAPPRGAAPAPR